MWQSSPSTFYLQYDVSVPLSVFYELVEVMHGRCDGVAKCTTGHGHVGDGEGQREGGGREGAVIWETGGHGKWGDWKALLKN